MNETTHKHSVVVGLFVLFGMAILLGGVLLLGNLNRSLQKRIRIESFIDNVNGLQKGNYVWLSGVRIGTIYNLRLQGDSGVEVMMDIDSRVKEFIHKDSRVKLGSDSFIGNRILIIFGGNSMSGNIEEGDTLRFEKTLSADDLIGTLQQNNENLKAITGDFKVISSKLAAGEGTIGKFLTDDSFYSNINSAASSLREATGRAYQLISSLTEFSEGLKKKGTLAYELTTDTIVFTDVRSSVIKLNRLADSATVMLNQMKEAAHNPGTSIGVLLNDKESGTDLKATLKNLEQSSEKLNEDLEALQHSFLMKRYFRDKAKAEKKSDQARQNKQ